MKQLIGIISIAVIMGLSATHAVAQYRSDFEQLKGNDDNDIVYQGFLTFNDLRNVPAFDLDDAAANYEVNSETMELLKDSLRNYDILVFLGTWCEDSQRMLPHLFRILTDINYPEEQLTLHGVDRNKAAKEGADEPYDIKLVPTVILMKDGVEQGRITEIPEKTLEDDLWNIINK